ncbi:ferritin family protein [Pyrodictium delaneyi]|uniref:ferritin family protein n=1 Tax=Pyrodictium delaneyi TaxID=1273541 RepID=UPI00117AF229|nr:ferritin family protein [Pyrodictium delaneyi]
MPVPRKPRGPPTGPSYDDSRLAEELKVILREKASGFLTVLNFYSRQIYGYKYHVVLARSPASAFNVLETAYKSRALYVARNLLAKPLIEALGVIDVDINKVVELAAKGDDRGIMILLGLAEGEVYNEDSKVELYKAVSTALACALRVEKLTAEIYSQLAEKLDDTLTAALHYIARGSQAHAHVLEHIAETLKLETQHCMPEANDIISELEKLLEWLEDRDKISRREAIAILNKLASAEATTSEEEYMRLLVPLLEDAFEGKTLRLFHGLLESIIRDEENHEKIVKTIYDILLDENND